MGQAPRARARKREKAGGNVILKAEPLHHRIKAVWEQEQLPVEVREKDPVRVPAGVREKAGVRDKAEAGGLNKIQKISLRR